MFGLKNQSIKLFQSLHIKTSDNRNQPPEGAHIILYKGHHHTMRNYIYADENLRP